MKLIVKYFGKNIKEIQLEEGKEYLIGRHKDCDVVLEENSLSRKHVKIYCDPDSKNWIVESISDLGGLYLEGEEIEGVELEESVELFLQNYILDFVKDPPPPPPPPPDPVENESKPKNTKSVVELSKTESTKMLGTSDLIYSLHIYIYGELSDYVRLNEGKSWIIGRSEDCDISIDYSVLTRKHFQINKDNGCFYIKDLGSANKTYLNGKKLISHKESLLKVNDEISVSELKIVFEIRNKGLEQLVRNLPATVPKKTQETSANFPAVPVPKVVLEDIPEESDDEILEVTAKRKTPRGFKTILLLVVVVVAVGVGLYFQREQEKKEKLIMQQQQKDKEYKNKLEAFYQEALTMQEEQKYQLCIDQIEQLHEVARGYFKDSSDILIQCQNGIESQRQKEEYLAQEEIRKQTEAKIKRIASECKKQFQEGKIQTEDELNLCAKDLLGGLDPANEEISAIQMEIQERENLRRMEADKKEAFRALVAKKRVLYNKAKKKKDATPLSDAPKVIVFYDVFLKAAKGFSPLKALFDQATKERDNLQQTYTDTLNGLYQSCEALISNKELKKAYYNCQEILDFKRNDKKAKGYMKKAKDDLQLGFITTYRKSMEYESDSRIEDAKKLWQKIVEQDIKEGYYYRKALYQLNRYK